MAGLWELAKQGAVEGISSHLMDAAMVKYATGQRTRTQIRDDLNATRETPLTVEELADLNGLADELDARGTTQAKMVYNLTVQAEFTYAELGLVTEAQWRATLGI